ncbi:ATP-grasp domain containing 1 [Monoraphidium neglectum]|uniref:ATP-grasp domain containing 1 n=1 Tax=Monoraphidium neglectum TaxID=145388 RepID=A0A0D2MIX4_9CHLO|nr:ATP-grasp domain containing 1 [Monoraphidium neglectum]KIZ02970.1 ATP-grasp domain containing 1 [Monoraphidium neglectum]|eukprot:XP_013901989.1 ATP-grasp domain containing 1 [Monoraphidium neglectum]
MTLLSWSRTLVDEGLAEKFIPIDFAEADTVLDRCLEALTDVRASIGLDGVTTYNEFAVQLVARLAERLGLPGNSPAAVDHARDKGATRRIMSAANLPSPKHTLINSPEEVDAAAAHVGFPAVIKPIAAAASMGVVRVNDLDELRSKVAATQSQLSRLYLDDEVGRGHIQTAEEGVVVSAADRAKLAQLVSQTLMMEEYLDGGEVDVDLVMSGGECTYGAITDNWPTIEPYFNETGSNCPSVLPLADQRALIDLAVATVQVLGFKLGVFHVELKATSRGPRLIEVNARMGGGGVRDINLAVWGVDLVDQHLLASAGLPARPLIAQRPLLRLAEYSVNAPATGVIESTDFLEPWAGLPGMIYARPLVAPGDKVISIADGMPTWVYEVCAAKPTVREAIAFVKDIEAKAVLPIRPLPAAV